MSTGRCAILLIEFGRTKPAGFGIVVGLAVAAASVHLLARINALDEQIMFHWRQSPHHLLRVGRPKEVSRVLLPLDTTLCAQRRS